jgi:hypothetical protein
MRWFQHETDAHRDTKIKKLINDFGAEGYAVYFYCLELIAGDLDSDNITFELEDDAQLVGQYLKVDTLRVEKIMKKCLELELFGINETGRITCIKMAKFLSADYTRSPKLKKLITSSKMNKVRKQLSYDKQKTVGRQSETFSATVPNPTTPNPTEDNSSGSPKPPNDYHFLVSLFSELYLSRYGTKYIAAREDHNIFKVLMQAGATRPEIEKRLDIYFKGNLWFTKDTAVSIKSFRSRYNDIPISNDSKTDDIINEFVNGGK